MGTLHTRNTDMPRVHLSQPLKAWEVNQLSRTIDESESAEELALDKATEVVQLERDMGLPDWMDPGTDDLAEGEIAPHLHDE